MLNIPVSKDYHYAHTIEYEALKLAQSVLNNEQEAKIRYHQLALLHSIEQGEIYPSEGYYCEPCGITIEGNDVIKHSEASH